MTERDVVTLMDAIYQSMKARKEWSDERHEQIYRDVCGPYDLCRFEETINKFDRQVFDLLSAIKEEK